jgi:hypothetical protein
VKERGRRPARSWMETSFSTVMPPSSICKLGKAMACSRVAAAVVLRPHSHSHCCPGGTVAADSLLRIISGILDELFKRFFVSRSG